MFWWTIRKLSVRNYKSSSKLPWTGISRDFIDTEKIVTRDKKFTEISLTTEEFLAQPQIENLDIK